MPKRTKQKGSAKVLTFHGSEKELQQLQQRKMQQNSEFAFQKTYVNAPQRCLLRTNGNRQLGGGLETYTKFDQKNAKNTNAMPKNKFAPNILNPIIPQSNHAAPLQKLENTAPPDPSCKTESKLNSWMQQKSKTSTSKIRLEAVKPSVSPLARNRFYELRDKTPVRHNSKQLNKEQSHNNSNNDKKNNENNKNDNRTPQIDIGWTQVAKKSQMQLHKPITPKNSGILTIKKSSHQADTYVNVDGSRNWLTNWREQQPPKPFNAVETLRFPDPPPCRQQTSSKMKLQENELSHRPFYKASYDGNEKIAPLHNLATPVRDLWVSRPEHADYSQVRCVKILPEHHQCAGPVRSITPNDVDINTLASKLEKHSRMQEPGSRNFHCICFRKTRRAYCTVCKATIIGRAFRKCRMHPDVGFLTDHFYCPFCCAEPSALKDI